MLRIIVALLLSTITAFPVIAQAVTAVVNKQTKMPAAPERISVAFENMPLAEALLTIARRSGMRVTFDNSKLPAKRVTYHAEGVTPDAAFAAILSGTGFRTARLASGMVEVVQTGSGKASRAQGVITGKVTDAKTGKGIFGATVSVGNDARGITTGEDGSYRLTGVAAGTHTVTVRLVGYAKQTRSVTVGEGATLTADFTLEPTASVLDQVIITGTVVATELKAVPSAITVVTAKQIEERGITRIDQLFRGEIPGLFGHNMSSDNLDDKVTMFSRGATALVGGNSAGVDLLTENTNPIKTYVDGVELANPAYLSQIDPKSIERIEILAGPQASTIYGSNAFNGVMQIFTKRGSSSRPQLTLSLLSGWVENSFSSARTPQHDYNGQISGVEGRMSYSGGGSWNYMGPWTPAKQTARRGGFGGVRLEMPAGGGSATADVTLRRTDAKTRVKASVAQPVTSFIETGWYRVDGLNGQSHPHLITVTGQTFGLTVNYAPTSWWSHEAGIGQDVTDKFNRYTGRGHKDITDTSLQLVQDYTERRSLRYAMTARVPVTSLAQATVTLGADAWQSLTTANIVNGLNSTTGDVSGNPTFFLPAYIGRRYPDHNTGGFLQTQVGIMDRLFFTYGLRAEWNPSFGAEAQPNYAPRYGMAYTHELGALTAKLRGSYGRATRPPATTLKNAQTLTQENFRVHIIPDYGDAIVRLANPELAPEHQQGGEGGLEFYFGSRGSLVVTRYNQTVDGLIDEAKVDSVRSLTNTPASWESLDADGYGYLHQRQFVNVGSIRNQGWELQGSVNTGPLTTRGTYSWTKSRTIGVTPKFRAQFPAGFYPQYQPGATVDFFPEHTWAIGMTYARPQTTVALNVNGIGEVRGVNDEFYYKNLNQRIRLPQNRLRVIGGYRGSNRAYALADLTASHRFSGRMEGVLQVQNLTDSYTNDFSGNFATIGRQTKAGLRIRM